MATLTFDIPGALLARIIDGICLRHHYQATIPNPAFNPSEPEGPGNERTIPNPVTKAQFAKRITAGWLIDQILTGETEAEQEALRLAKWADKDTLTGQVT